MITNLIIKDSELDFPVGQFESSLFVVNKEGVNVIEAVEKALLMLQSTQGVLPASIMITSHGEPSHGGRLELSVLFNDQEFVELASENSSEDTIATEISQEQEVKLDVLFKKISEIYQDQPVFTSIFSCHSGAGQKSLQHLPKGSYLYTSVPEDLVEFSFVGSQLIFRCLNAIEELGEEITPRAFFESLSPHYEEMSLTGGQIRHLNDELEIQTDLVGLSLEEIGNSVLETDYSNLPAELFDEYKIKHAMLLTNAHADEFLGDECKIDNKLYLYREKLEKILSEENQSFGNYLLGGGQDSSGLSDSYLLAYIGTYQKVDKSMCDQAKAKIEMSSGKSLLQELLELSSTDLDYLKDLDLETIKSCDGRINNDQYIEFIGSEDYRLLSQIIDNSFLDSNSMLNFLQEAEKDYKSIPELNVFEDNSIHKAMIHPNGLEGLSDTLLIEKFFEFKSIVDSDHC